MQIDNVVEPVKKSSDVDRHAFDPRSAILNSKWENKDAHADMKESQKRFLGFKYLLYDCFSGVGNL